MKPSYENRSSPAISNGVIYIGSSDTLYAFDLPGPSRAAPRPKAEKLRPNMHLKVSI